MSASDKADGHIKETVFLLVTSASCKSSVHRCDTDGNAVYNTGPDDEHAGFANMRVNSGMDAAGLPGGQLPVRKLLPLPLNQRAAIK